MRPLSRWAVPGTVAVVIVAGATVPHAFASTPNPALPTVSAADLIAGVRTTPVDALSGTLALNSALGLPSLPDRLTGATSGAAALLTGSHTLKLWVDGPDQQRLALLGGLAETDVIHNGTDLWTYDSSSNTATHRVLSAPTATSDSPGSTGTDLTPQAAAARLLSNLDPTTAVAVDGTERVAGRSAYRLILTPRTTDTLVRSVAIDVDATSHIPLRVQIFGAGSAPAWSLGFSDVTFATPSASEFRFTPPKDATVTESPMQAQGNPSDSVSGGGSPGTASGGAESGTSDSGSKPQTTGTGWATVVEFPASDLNVGTAAGNGGSGHNSMLGWLNSAATPVPEGRLITTDLFSLLVTPDGRAFVGAVPPAIVRAAAAKTSGD